MKIIQSLVNGGHRTAYELLDFIKDVPQATLYRHLNKLLEAGFIEVVQENQIRGTVEKVYALKQTGITDVDNASKDQHLELFFTFLAHLMGMYEDYLSSGYNLQRDGVSYRVARMHLTDKEFMELGGKMGKLINEGMKNQPSNERKPRNLATIIVPENQ
ncbi:transcriptional regulator [Bacillus sp. FJAT-27225]|nr:transcriptional regulator [Bacillus sp. FJAT-27225]